jgi:hypothetical protein
LRDAIELAARRMHLLGGLSVALSAWQFSIIVAIAGARSTQKKQLGFS